jgi:ribosome-associated translation inhibitor RaiA
MNQEIQVLIHFNDIPVNHSVREHIEARCKHLADEFPEAINFEVHLTGDFESAQCHGHVSGKRTHAAAHVEQANNLRHAGDLMLDKVERELRREHDKRIFGPRRQAQKSQTKRTA